LTDHGNMNNMVHQFLHSRKMKAEGRYVKPIYGVEAYFTPSINDWVEAYGAGKEIKGEDNSATLIQDNDDERSEVDPDEISKILKRRRHLVLLAKNQVGLNNIFELISRSYKSPNFYKFPRMDYEMLTKHSEGIVATSACLTGDSMLDTSFGPLCIKNVIQNLLRGQEIYVLSYSEQNDKVEFKKVLWGDLTRAKTKVIKITLKNGKCLRLTPDHKVYTNKGWMEAGDLKGHKNIKILSLNTSEEKL